MSLIQLTLLYCNSSDQNKTTYISLGQNIHTQIGNDSHRLRTVPEHMAKCQTPETFKMVFSQPENFTQHIASLVEEEYPSSPSNCLQNAFKNAQEYTKTETDTYFISLFFPPCIPTFLHLPFPTVQKKADAFPQGCMGCEEPQEPWWQAAAHGRTIAHRILPCAFGHTGKGRDVPSSWEVKPGHPSSPVFLLRSAAC